MKYLRELFSKLFPSKILKDLKVKDMSKEGGEQKATVISKTTPKLKSGNQEDKPKKKVSLKEKYPGVAFKDLPEHEKARLIKVYRELARIVGKIRKGQPIDEIIASEDIHRKANEEL